VLAKIADFLDGEALNAAPQAATRQAARAFVDTLGCIIGGSACGPGQSVTVAIAEIASGGPCSVPGTLLRTDVTHAAYLNAYLADVLDFEDTLVSHPSAVVIPVALAVGEHVGASGRDVLRAVLAGYEVGTRVARALRPSSGLAREVAAEFYWKPVAAAVTAGVLLGLRGCQWETALGYAASAAPSVRRGGLELRPLTWLKTNFGGQAEVGVRAAFLARGGFSVNRGLLDGPRTFAGVLGSDRWEPEAQVEDLGVRWLIEDTTFKYFPCCLYLHPVAEAVTRAAAGHRHAIERITVRVPRVLASEFDDRRPAGIIDAQFSVPYVAAVCALGIDPGARWWSPDTLADPAVLALMDSVTVAADEGLSTAMDSDRSVTAAVTIRFTDGTVSSHVTRAYPGSAARPLTDEQLDAKFTGLCLSAGHLSSMTAAALEQAHAIGSLPDVRDLLPRGFALSRETNAATDGTAVADATVSR
jgi:2-methylcitrate dehydratase PrpD